MWAGDPSGGRLPGGGGRLRTLQASTELEWKDEGENGRQGDSEATLPKEQARTLAGQPAPSWAAWMRTGVKS